MNKIFDQDRTWQDDPWDEAGVLPDEGFDPLPRSGRAWRWVVLLVVAAMLAGVVAVGGVAYWGWRQINPSAEPGAPVNLTVDKGMTVSDIADRLERSGVVDSASVFRWYVGTKGGIILQPGYFTIREHEKFDEIINILQTPPELTYTKVTFPEGMTLEQIAKRLQEKVPRLSADKFLALAASGQATSTLAPPGTTNLEGLLFPDTYQIAANEDELAVVKRMADLMERIAGKEQVDTRGTPQAQYDVIKIASLIEREAKTDDDRPKIARVIYNRIAAKMTLDIDASLLYGTPGAQDAITDEMKAADNPYNLYKYAGLPPTPIAMPSRASIHAAMNPYEGVDGEHWLYYVVSDREGHHAFANTYQEHLRNVAAARAAGLF